jgi:hypothetical protein
VPSNPSSSPITTLPTTPSAPTTSAPSSEGTEGQPAPTRREATEEPAQIKPSVGLLVDLQRVANQMFMWCCLAGIFLAMAGVLVAVLTGGSLRFAVRWLVMVAILATGYWVTSQLV